MKRYKIAVFINLDEYYIGTTHHHRTMGRVIEFEDSKPAAEKQYDLLVNEIFKLVAKAEKAK